MRAYDHSKIEKKWQKAWAAAKLYETPDSAEGKENFYLLVEFPYPSGNLHVGHWYAFAVPDILARHLRMKGKNVLYPIGFDAFGLPAENAAIKNKIDPRKWTEENISYMQKQIASMGTSFDTSREVQTCDPAYYKWTQWLFLQLFKAKLAYRKEVAVNWCPKDKTVLANEQVINGHCERCDSLVEQKHMLQWNLKITEYADRLIDDLKPLDWPEEIKTSQRNWIGRSEGAEIDFALDLGKQYRYVLLHGFESSPDRPRYVWMKAELEKLGHEVIIPALPNPDHPSEDEQVAEALSAAEYDENTVLFGHSLGGAVALKVAEKLKKPIARLVLAGAAVNPNFKDRPRNFESRFTWKFDGVKIRRNAKSITILHDPRDYAIGEEQVAILEELLGVAAIHGRSNEPHFTGDTEPDILMWLRPTIRVFTTRPDTLFGATYLVLAPEHPWVRLAVDDKHDVLKNKKEVRAYVAAASKKTELERQTEQKEKTGVELKGVKAINPATAQKIPLWVADYVFGNYGTGAVMGVPAHDERDFEFATKLNLPIIQVISSSAASIDKKAYVGDGLLTNSAEFDGSSVADGQKRITKAFGRVKTSYKLHDWIVSRQRYWGVPIPIVHCEKCGAVPVPEKDLPVLLPDVKDYLPTGNGKSPLAKVKKFVNTECPHCGGAGERETDTLDTFVDSSWYFLAYCAPEILSRRPGSSQFQHPAIQRWMPVDLYSGGAEHTTMHLLYSRFWHKALFDLGLVADSEPYRRRMNRSIILGPDNQKMSKSRGNVIDPDEIVKRLGADTVRMYLAFVGPYNEVGTYPWNPDGVVGVRRFLERVCRVKDLVKDSETSEPGQMFHKVVKKVGEDILAMKFNTAISQLMILLNAMEKADSITNQEWELFLKLLAPFAPHLSEELWHESGHKSSVHLEQWPTYDSTRLEDQTKSIAIQINGKTRGEVLIRLDESRETIEMIAAIEVAQRLGSKRILRTIVVPGRLVNFVVEE